MHRIAIYSHMHRIAIYSHKHALSYTAVLFTILSYMHYIAINSYMGRNHGNFLGR
jgi:hypothetical protein